MPWVVELGLGCESCNIQPLETYWCSSELDLDLRVGLHGGEGLEGLFGHPDDHGLLRFGLTHLPWFGRAMQRQNTTVWQRHAVELDGKKEEGGREQVKEGRNEAVKGTSPSASVINSSPSSRSSHPAG